MTFEEFVAAVSGLPDKDRLIEHVAILENRAIDAENALQCLIWEHNEAIGQQ